MTSAALRNAGWAEAFCWPLCLVLRCWKSDQTHWDITSNMTWKWCAKWFPAISGHQTWQWKNQVITCKLFSHFNHLDLHFYRGFSSHLWLPVTDDQSESSGFNLRPFPKVDCHSKTIKDIRDIRNSCQCESRKYHHHSITIYIYIQITILLTIPLGHQPLLTIYVTHCILLTLRISRIKPLRLDMVGSSGYVPPIIGNRSGGVGVLS